MHKLFLTLLLLFSVSFIFAIPQNGVSSSNRLSLRESDINIITKDYDLNGDTLMIPKGCVLKFENGSISNGVIYADYVFPVEASLTQIFRNVKFLVRNSGTFMVKAEWFGVDRQNDDSENAENLQMLLNSNRNLHVLFQDGIYRFNIVHPVMASGQYVLTGESSGFFSEIPRTNFLITGKPMVPTFFLTLLTNRSTIKDIAFSSMSGEDSTILGNIGCVFIKDASNDPGNIDSAVDGCLFAHVGCPLKAYGRGLSITNCRFQQGGGVVIKQSHTKSDNYTQKPPYDGRGLFVDNIRVHWLYRGCQASGEYNGFGGKDYTFMTIQHNEEEEGSTFFGVMINNVYADGACQFMDCDSDINCFTLTNVFCPLPIGNFLHFKRNASNIIVSKVTAEHFYHRSPSHFVHFATFNGNMEYCIFTDNIFGVMKDALIAVEGTQQEVKNCIIANNIVKGCSELITNSQNVINLNVENNIIDK